MNYTLIGTGNMAWFLANRLYKQGYKCVGVYGRNKTAAHDLAQQVHAPSVEKLESLPEADCCIIAIADGSIAEVATSLQLKETVVLHTAGSLSMDAIPQTNKGVVWPIYSISKNNLPDHRNLPVVYEYNTERSQQVVSKVAYAVSDIVNPVNWQQRQWLHLCAVVGNNFTNHLMAVCEIICREQDLPFSLVRPIILQTFDGISSIEPALVQTGPAVRKDYSTIANHLELLAAHPHWQTLYRALSASIEDMYKTEGK
jgi:predicted short-subunit dehydrogenase-like oxidoreductase (DUF2520 family)